MITLREKEINKLAAMLQLPEDQLERLHSMRLLDESKAIDILVRYEYARLKRTELYNVKQITEALMREYDISRGKVQNAIYNKRKGKYFCRICGRAISNHRHLNYDDVCKSCVTNSINF
jgi:transcription initiation factor IIE alpha subunit